jgi:streptogramin lyase
MLTGCGMGPVITSSTGTLAISGIVHGGQNPVTGSSIQLYTVGSSGNASAAIPMLKHPVATIYGGDFSIDEDYTCGESSSSATIPGGSQQVYIVATGGNPGLAQGTDNDKLVLMAALGDCSKLSTTSFIEINEVTTAAAVWALAPFMTSSPNAGTTATNIGATATNAVGIQNAFLDAGLLADTSTGLPAKLPANLSIETDKLDAFADAIASCVNSDGTSGCNNLFAAATSTGVTRPADTLTAALDIVTHPGTNVAAVFTAIGGYTPFATDYAQAPNDWTMSLTVSGGGLALPGGLAIDVQNNVWVAGEQGPLSVFGPQGAPLSDTGFSASDTAFVYAVAADSAGNLWITNYNGGGSRKGSITEFLDSDGPPSSRGSIVGEYTSGILYPTALSADTHGNIFIAEDDSTTAAMYNSAGSLVYSNLGADLGLNAHPYGIAADSSGGFWLSDNDDTIAHISAPSSSYPEGQLLGHPSCCSESYGLAVDADGTVWVADYLGGTNFAGAFAEVVTDIHGNVTTPISSSQVGGINHPAFVTVDGGQNVWISNYRGNSITEIAGNHTSVAGGTALSPSLGLYGTITTPRGGYGRDVPLDDPLGIAPDRSGNVWVSNENTDTLVMFFGLATPTVTPVQPVPTVP